MRNSWADGWALFVAATLALTGCGAQAPGSNGGGRPDAAPAQPDEVSLVGCIGTASGTRDIVLQNNRFDRESGSRTQSESTDRGVTEGAWVRLAGADASELVRHAGRQVRVRGSLTDDTRTTGTAGSEDDATPSTGPGTPLPSGDRSQAASDQHHANKQADEAGPIARDFLPPGPPPDLRVRQIQETGQRCSEAPR